MRHDRDHDHGKQIKFEVFTITHKVEILQTIWGYYRYTYIYSIFCYDPRVRISTLCDGNWYCWGQWKGTSDDASVRLGHDIRLKKTRTDGIQ